MSTQTSTATTKLVLAEELATIAAAIEDEMFRAEVLAQPRGLFSHPAALKLLEAIEALELRAEPVSRATVAREAEALGLSSAAAVVDRLPQPMDDRLPSLRREWLRRVAQETAKSLLSAGADPGRAVEEALDRLTEAVSGVDGQDVHISESIAVALERQRLGPPRLLSTGIPELDESLAILGPGDLVVLGARPGMGKTALAVQTAYHSAQTTGVYYATLEMDAPSIAQRLMAQSAGAPPELAARAPIYLLDRGGLTPEALMAAVRRRKAYLERDGQALGLVVVDYLQLLNVRTPERTREREVAKISASLKAMARRLGVLVLALSQLNRAVDGRPARRPELSDLRESGALEQDADAVLLLHRPRPSQAELILAKMRNGATGTVSLGWEPGETRFYSIREGGV